MGKGGYVTTCFPWSILGMDEGGGYVTGAISRSSLRMDKGGYVTTCAPCVILELGRGILCPAVNN